jgi:TolB-like protein/cytochrome c-type biogenesis protein CcmH/NrfG
MKRCPHCRRDYFDDSLLYCLDDGSALLDGPAFADGPATAILPDHGRNRSEPTRLFGTDPQAGTVSMSGYLPNSIAVLPFVHLSKDPDDEYFCDGLAEELINALSCVDDLKVVARTTSFSFKGKDIDIAKIGSILNVNNVVEGSVRKFGDRMRINVQLINTADGYNVWSDKYDTQMRDLFDVQDEITLAVVDALKGKLLRKIDPSDQMSALIDELRQHVQDVEAYQLYLRGRYFFNKFTVDDYYRALDCFQKAVEIDPGYAESYAGIADVHIWLTELGPETPREGMPKARDAALKAISLDPESSEAHTSLAIVLQEFDYDFAQAESQYLKALEINPNNSMAAQLYGALLAQLGRFDEAESRFRTAQELDPLSLINWLYPFGLFLARRYDDSIERTQSILELKANNPAAILILSFDYQMKQDFAACVETYTRFLELCDLSEIAAIGRSAYEQDEWQGFLKRMTDAEVQPHVTSYITAVFHAALGENDRAIGCLREAFDQREGHVVMLNYDPRFDGLREDPRFQQLLRDIGFPPA